MDLTPLGGYALPYNAAPPLPPLETRTYGGGVCSAGNTFPNSSVIGGLLARGSPMLLDATSDSSSVSSPEAWA